VKPTGVALTAVAGNGGLAVLWNITCPQLAQFSPAEQAAMHTLLASIAAGTIAVLVRLVARTAHWAERELANDPPPTGARAWRLELLAGLHGGQ
jgi:hypothetical protein